MSKDDTYVDPEVRQVRRFVGLVLLLGALFWVLGRGEPPERAHVYAEAGDRIAWDHRRGAEAPVSDAQPHHAIYWRDVEVVDDGSVRGDLIPVPCRTTPMARAAVALPPARRIAEALGLETQGNCLAR